jgi:RNA polymerase sigma factor (sigma-70 family)
MLMRFVVGIALVNSAGSALLSSPAIPVRILSVLLGGAAILLIIGLYTPIVGTAVAVIESFRLLTIPADNAALMLMRKRRSRSETSYDQRSDQDQERPIWEFADRSPNPEQIYAKRQLIERMAVAVNRLSPRYRDLVQQFHGTEQSLQETAQKLGIKVGAAKSRLMRARLKMRSRLEMHGISFADTCH